MGRQNLADIMSVHVFSVVWNSDVIRWRHWIPCGSHEALFCTSAVFYVYTVTFCQL